MPRSYEFVANLYIGFIGQLRQAQLSGIARTFGNCALLDEQIRDRYAMRCIGD
jgi:hypothetical protein